MQTFPSVALTVCKQQRSELKDLWTLVLSERVLPLSCEAVKALQPNDMPLTPLFATSSLLLQLVRFCLSVQVFTQDGAFFSSSISSIQILQLTKPSFITTQRQLCTSLCHACYPVSLMFWHSVDRACFIILPTSLHSSSRLQ